MQAGGWHSGWGWLTSCVIGGYTMATTQNATAITLTVTDKAAAEVRKFMAEEHVAPETAGLRVGVLPGGCSGFRYSLSIEDKPAADDIVIESGGVRCFVDSF